MGAAGKCCEEGIGKRGGQYRGRGYRRPAGAFMQWVQEKRSRGRRAAMDGSGFLTFESPKDLLPLILQLSLQLLPPLPLLRGLVFFLRFSRIPGGSPAQNLPRGLPILILYSHSRRAATQQWQEEVRVGCWWESSEQKLAGTPAPWHGYHLDSRWSLTPLDVEQ